MCALAAAGVIATGTVAWASTMLVARSAAVPGTAGARYASMPSIAPIGVRIEKYVEVPNFAKGPAVDAVKGYRTQTLGDGLYMITDGAYQSMFMTYEDGVVVVDAPPSYASRSGLRLPK